MSRDRLCESPDQTFFNDQCLLIGDTDHCPDNMELNDGPKNEGFCDCLNIEGQALFYSDETGNCHVQNTRVCTLNNLILWAPKLLFFLCLKINLSILRFPFEKVSGLCSTKLQSANRFHMDVQLTANTFTGDHMIQSLKNVGKSDARGLVPWTKFYI